MMRPDKFLELYKEYEALVRAKGGDPKDSEEKSEGVLCDRLRMCRLFRNYFAHTADPGFLEVSDKMASFLEGQVVSLRSEGDVVKKHLKKPEACMLSEGSKCGEAFEKFGKLGCFSLPVCMKDGTYKMLSIFDTVGSSDRVKVSLFKLRPVKPVFCGPLDDYAYLDPDKVTFCTDDGTPDGKLLGRVWFPVVI